MLKHFRNGAFLALWVVPTLVYGEEQFQVNTLTVESQTGTNKGSASSQSPLSGFFKAQKELVGHLLTQIGMPPESLPPEVKKALAQPHTTNMQALIAFSEGLAHLDNDRFTEAKTSFTQAVSLDPSFGLAVTLEKSMPQILTNVNEVAVVATQKGQEKAKTILEKVEKSNSKESEKPKTVPLLDLNEKKPEAEENILGGLRHESSSQEHLEISTGKTEPILNDESYSMVQKPENIEQVIQNIQAQQSVSTNTVSSPACVADLCGFYTSAFYKSTATGWSALGNPYITEQGVGLTTGGTVGIAQKSSTGYLTGTASPFLANITAFKEAETGTTASSSTTPLTLQPTVVTQYSDTSGASALEVGYNGVQSSAMQSFSATFSPSSLFFAEGAITPAADLTSLAQNSTNFGYSGVAVSQLNNLSEKSTGTFSANVNFATNQVSSLNISNTYTTGEKSTISAPTATLAKDGSFAINPTASGTSFQIQPATGGSTITVSDGLVAGRTFGKEASALGGVYTLQGSTTGATTPTHSIVGSFGGQRTDINSSGTVSGSVP
ncbi:MAG: hypothetical protein HQL94_06405 [Magnetococcales bacterium]|nr:hypothetical protein [Magnetococcales bacterium]